MHMEAIQKYVISMRKDEAEALRSEIEDIEYLGRNQLLKLHDLLCDFLD